MKLEDINPIVIHGTGYYKKGCKTLYRRVFKGELTQMYFRELFRKLSSGDNANIKELGKLKKCIFRIKHWKYKMVVVSDGKVSTF